MSADLVHDPVRLISAVGAAVALIRAPDFASLPPISAPGVLVDVEILSPDRLVRYLDRRLELGTADLLAESFLAAAVDSLPGQTVEMVDDQEAGLAFGFLESTPFTVALEVLTPTDLTGDVPEHHGVVFDVLRSSLITAAHTLRVWSKSDDMGILA